MKHYAAINADGFQGNAWGATPARALETIIRDSSGPADPMLMAVHPCTALESPSMTLYEVPDNWDSDAAVEAVRDGVFVGLFQIEWDES